MQSDKKAGESAGAARYSEYTLPFDSLRRFPTDRMIFLPRWIESVEWARKTALELGAPSEKIDELALRLIGKYVEDSPAETFWYYSDSWRDFKAALEDFWPQIPHILGIEADICSHTRYLKYAPSQIPHQIREDYFILRKGNPISHSAVHKAVLAAIPPRFASAIRLQPPLELACSLQQVVEAFSSLPSYDGWADTPYSPDAAVASLSASAPAPVPTSSIAARASQSGSRRRRR